MLRLKVLKWNLCDLKPKYLFRTEDFGAAPARGKHLKAKHVPAVGQDWLSSPAQRFWDVLCTPMLAAGVTQEWCFPCPRSYLIFIAISDCRKRRGLDFRPDSVRANLRALE